MDYATYASSMSFRFLQPDAVPESSHRFALTRGEESVWLLEVPGSPVDVPNTALPSLDGSTRSALRDLCEMPRMSTFAIAALINRAVAQMPRGQAFVNIGVWNGFTFLAGMAGNADKLCVGVDDFSQFESPEETFTTRFEALRSPRHDFHKMDYRDYFAGVHRDPIGVYLYDGEHSYENQLEGLRAAEPFLADGCLVIVDDTNWPQPREATLDFVSSSGRDYELLLDCVTPIPVHPTLWNGVMVLRAEGTGGAVAADTRPPTRHASSTGSAAPAEKVSAFEPPPRGGTPLVSLIVHEETGEGDRLAAAIEAALEQRWPSLEVLVADERPSERSERAIAAFSDSVTAVRAKIEGGSAIDAALALSRGDFVAVADAHAPLPSSAVRMGLGFPDHTQFFRTLTDEEYAVSERLLLAGEEIESVLPPNGRFILVTETLPVSSDQVRQKLRMPTWLAWRRPLELSRRGGRPLDDHDAVTELEAQRGAGAGLIAFLWPAFWWLERYPGLDRHLRDAYRCVLESERVIAFDLRR